MAPEIPTQFKFEELLSNTFPGFFSALTLFMSIDYLSPINIFALISKNILNLAGFIGYVILFGTILGIIIDGIHHSLIENLIFEKSLGFKEIYEPLKILHSNNKLTFPYFYNIIEDKTRAIDNHEYMINAQYRYSEFYANTFIALVPFSFITPFYLLERFQIPWIVSLFFGFLSLITASICLHSSYETYRDYHVWKFSILCGYLNYHHIVDLKAEVVFNWDEIPGKESDRFIEFLKKNYNINWANRIEKPDDNTINISSNENFLSLTHDKGKVELKINKYKIDEFIFKEERNKRNFSVYGKKVPSYKKCCNIIATRTPKTSKIPLSVENIEVIFETTLGYIVPKNNGKTDSNGRAIATLYSDNCGTAVVTATSEDCIPNTINVKFKRHYHAAK